MIQIREWSVSDLADQLGISIAATSQHLSKLREAGVVTARAEGKRRLHRADPDAFARLAPMLEIMWTADIDELARVAEKEHARGRK